jgi:hypothetical protein
MKTTTVSPRRNVLTPILMMNPNRSCSWRSSVADCTVVTAYHSVRAFSSAWRNEAVGKIMTNSSPVTRQEVVFTVERRTLLHQGNQDAITDGMAMSVVDLLTISDVQQEERKRG